MKGNNKIELQFKALEPNNCNEFHKTISLLGKTEQATNSNEPMNFPIKCH